MSCGSANPEPVISTVALLPTGDADLRLLRTMKNTFIDFDWIPQESNENTSRRSNSVPPEMRYREAVAADGQRKAEEKQGNTTPQDTTSLPDSAPKQLPLGRTAAACSQDIDGASEEEPTSGETLQLAQATFEAPSPGSRRRRNRRRGNGQATATRPAPTLESEIKKCGSAQEIVALVSAYPEALQDASTNSLITILHTAADFLKKAPEGRGVPIRDMQGFRLLIQTLERHLSTGALDANSIPKLFWSLGKLEAKEHSQRVIRHVAQVLRTQWHVLSTFDPRDLSNCIYGIAKMSCKEAKKEQNLLADRFITELTNRVNEWITDSQCLSNSVYAVAVLNMHGAAVQSFLQVCTTKLAEDDQMFNRFTPQGVSNTIWSLEKLAIHRAAWMSRERMRSLLLNARNASHSRLDTFLPQELSSFALALSKLMESLTSRRPSNSIEVGSLEHFVVDMAEAAGRQRERLAPQGHSNLGLALEKARVLKHPASLVFIADTAEISTTRLAEWTPQAISNFAYVLGKLPFLQRGSRVQTPYNQAMLALARAWMDSASFECRGRLQLLSRKDPNNFSWQDLSGVINTLGKIPEFGTPGTKEMVFEVVTIYAPGSCFQMSTQSMLNIGVAALTIGISTQQMEPMKRDIAAQIARRTPNITPKDLDQWAKIREWR